MVQVKTIGKFILLHCLAFQGYRLLVTRNQDAQSRLLYLIENLHPKEMQLAAPAEHPQYI